MDVGMFLEKIKVTLLVFIVLSLSACGGGGAGGAVTPLPDNLMGYYNGKIDSAHVDLTTTRILIEELLYVPAGKNEFRSLSQREIASKDTLSFMENKRSTLYLKQLPRQKKTKVATTRSSEQAACDSGAIITSESLNQNTGVGQVILTYDNCYLNGTLFTGKIITDFQKWNIETLEPIDYAQTYLQVRVEEVDGFYTEMNGKIQAQGATTCDQMTTSNIVISSSEPERVFFQDNYRQTIKCNLDNGMKNVTLSGRVYLGQSGWIDLQTDKTLIINQHGYIFSGVLRLNGLDSSVTLEGLEYTDMNYGLERVKLSVDANNDGLYEVDAVVPYRYLNDEQILNDLQDSDSDGMWDSWETYYGLNPNVDDTQEDLDGDGFSNWLEFKGISNPNLSADIPYVGTSSNNSISNYLIFTGVTQEIPINLQADIDIGLQDEFNNITVIVSLSTDNKWSLSGNDNCFIRRDELVELVCENLDLSSLVSEGTLTINGLQFTALESFGITELYARSESSFLRLPTLAGAMIEVIHTDGALKADLNNQAFVINEQSNNFTYTFALTEPVMIAGVDTILRGEVTTDIGLSIIGINGELKSEVESCTFTASAFECFITNNFNEINLVFSQPQETGHINLNMTIETIYTEEIKQQFQSEALIAIGYSMDNLSNQIQALPKGQNTLTVTPGIYVGSLAINREINLKGMEQVELWLQPENSSDSDLWAENWPSYRGIEMVAEAPLTLSGFDIYCSENCLNINGGKITGNHFYLLDEASRLVFSTQSTNFSNNRIDDLGRDTNGNADLLFLHGDSVVSNNLVIANSDSSWLFAYVSTDDSLQSNSLILSNNTFVGVDRITKIYGWSMSKSITNNLIIGVDEEVVGLYDLFSTDVALQNNILPTRFSDSFATDNIFSDMPGVDENNDYRLLQDSIAIDAGIDVSDWLVDDIDGVSRKSGAGVDIGAYEYQQ